jgi:hypothetical protein
MANPTTNYGFVLPTPTDLVTDLPADFDVALQGVDTRLKALQPGTTLGDLAYSSATANTNTRLALGTAGQVLTVNSGATAPEWATSSSGGMTLLSTTTLSGTSTTISSISQSYKSLFMVIFGLTNATSNSYLICKPNNDASSAYYVGTVKNSLGGGSVSAINASSISPTFQEACLRTNNENSHIIEIYNYTSNSSTAKNFNVTSKFREAGNTYEGASQGGGGIIGVGAITSLVFALNGGQSISTGTVLLYGVS